MVTILGIQGGASRMGPKDAYNAEAPSMQRACPKDFFSTEVKLKPKHKYETHNVIMGCKKHPMIKGIKEVSVYSFIKGKSELYMIKKSFRLKQDKKMTATQYLAKAREVSSLQFCKKESVTPKCDLE